MLGRRLKTPKIRAKGREVLHRIQGLETTPGDRRAEREAAKFTGNCCRAMSLLLHPGRSVERQAGRLRNTKVALVSQSS